MKKHSIDIQRLTKPQRRGGTFGANPFSFGGGLRNGGLSDKAMELIDPICGFDYMGSAEFEFGALPKALSSMVEEGGDLVAFSVDVKTADRESSYWNAAADGVCEDTVFVLCPKDWREEVTARIRKFAEDEFAADTRERVCLEEAIRQRTKGVREPNIVGWIEINNGYCFFIDEDMWKQFCELFGAAV